MIGGDVTCDPSAGPPEGLPTRGPVKVARGVGVVGEELHGVHEGPS